MAEISRIKLPSGNSYEIKDAVARQMISGGVSFIIAWDGTDAPVVANIPEGVIVKYNSTNYTGTLTADSAEAGAFYLVKSSINPSSETLDIYDEYVPVGTTGSKVWEKIGDTQVNLSDVVTGVSLSKQTDVVLGEATTFTNGTSTVTFSGGTTDKVLGEATTFSVSKPTVTVTPSTTNIKGTASGTAVGANGTAAAVTGYPNTTTDTFVKSVSAETGKNLVTTSIVPTNGTESVSKVTKTASKLVTTTIPNVTGNSNVSIPNVTGNSAVTANKSTWTFTMGTGNDSETLIIGGGNGSDVTATNTTLGTNLSASKVTLGTAITAATGAVASTGTGSDIVTAVTISDKTVAKAGSAVTVATGATDENGTGDAVVTGVTVGTSGSALTGLGTPSTANALTGVKVTAQPTIALATGATAGTGVISVATGISSTTVGDQSITVGTNDKVTAVTGIGTGTAAAQKITVGTNDKVTVLKSNTDVAVTKGNA